MLGRLLLLNQTVDLLTVGTDVRPGIHQILGAQGRIVGQKLGLAYPTSTVLLQHPDRDPGAHDAWIAALHTRDALEAGEDLTDVSDENLEELGLLGRGHLCNQRLCLLEGSH